MLNILRAILNKVSRTFASLGEMNCKPPELYNHQQLPRNSLLGLLKCTFHSVECSLLPVTSTSKHRRLPGHQTSPSTYKTSVDSRRSADRHRLCIRPLSCSFKIWMICFSVKRSFISPSYHSQTLQESGGVLGAHVTRKKFASGP